MSESEANKSDEPQRIYLQIHGDSAPGAVVDGVPWTAVTWSRHRVFEADVEYIRAADHAAEIAAIRAERDLIYTDSAAKDALIAELKADRARIDWLADPANGIGNVQLPRPCVEQNLGSMRAAIDAAMVYKTEA